MAESRRTRVRLWRWRRNPLRRRSDVIEAWVVLAGLLLAVVGGLLAGLVAAGAVERAADRQRAQSRAVSAVLAEDAEDKAPARAVSDHRVWATVRWTAPDGSTRTDEARVPARTQSGDRIKVWVDESGITTAPLTDGEARIHAALGGVLAATGGGAVMLCATWVVRARLDGRRMAQWDAEWERIDTRWGRKTG
ncbi:Rv1733c family protein [Streptomyces sp. 2A115]|uniref:Rv1733c family protein n=1 Tax=Streptomyces sp. 2A115 TaxID=3457439 RepID=UPI003FD54113